MGEEPKKALYQYLSTIHLLKKEDIPNRVGHFAVGLRRALGASSKIVEKLTLKRLYEKIGSTFEEIQGFEFADYVEDARQKFMIIGPSQADSREQTEYDQSKKGQFSS